MKVPMKWLNDYVDVGIPIGEYAAKMVMAGTGVEGVTRTGDDIEGVVVGKITSISQLEGSGHMLVCQVDIGRETIQVVTGAPNVEAGQYVPVALDGASLPGGRIKSSALRGALSQGMLCSGPELNIPEGLYPHCGEAGIMILQEVYAPGTDIKEVLGLGGEVVDFEILANRPDCLSVWGIARETAATLDTHLVMPIIMAEEALGGPAFDDEVSVLIMDEALCPRYCARVIKNVRIGSSPMWMRERLYAAGVRPINTIVDITNYVMLETGHPMHAFDLSKIRDRSIIVRRAHHGERLTTLDGKEHALTPEMLVIADKQRATGLAGMMGGEESEITDATTDVVFECAVFDRVSIRMTSRSLGIRTESSGRFERGVCAATAAEAMERACMLVNILECGDVVRGIYDNYPNPLPERVVNAGIERMSKRISVTISGDEIKDILERLFFDVELDGDELRAVAPPYRMDIETEADLSEEILRLYGYDAIPSTLMRGEAMPGGRSPRQKLADRARLSMAGQGFHEIMCFSFVNPKWLNMLSLFEGDARLNPVMIKNPLGEETGAMRTTLVPSMLNTVSLNISRGNKEGKLFELAAAFIKTKDGELPGERLTLCAGMYGSDVDFYAMRNAVAGLLASYGIDGIETEPGGSEYYHQGRRALIRFRGVILGELGEIHPDVASGFEIERRVYVAAIDMGAVATAEVPIGATPPLPRYPAVTRDLALVVDESVPLGPLMDAMRRAGGQTLEHIELFDIYRGIQLDEGKKSAAFALSLRSGEGTLTEAEANIVIERIIDECARKYGVRLRA
jgi:phenylalanyl-tRNA synthetase beta chain